MNPLLRYRALRRHLHFSVSFLFMPPLLLLRLIRERHTHTQTDRQTETQRDRQRETETESERQTDRQTDRERQRNRDRDRESVCKRAGFGRNPNDTDS